MFPFSSPYPLCYCCHTFHLCIGYKSMTCCYFYLNSQLSFLKNVNENKCLSIYWTFLTIFILFYRFAFSYRLIFLQTENFGLTFSVVSTGLLVTNFLGLCLLENVFFSPSLLKDIWAGYKILGGQGFVDFIFSFQHWRSYYSIIWLVFFLREARDHV